MCVRAFVSVCLTPDASALVGDVVLQAGTEGRLPSSPAHAAIVHQQEGLVVVVQTVGVPGRVLDIVACRETPLEHRQRRACLDGCRVMMIRVEIPFYLPTFKKISEEIFFNIC